jgi:hypothetical protein
MHTVKQINVLAKQGCSFAHIGGFVTGWILAKILPTKTRYLQPID